jgi:hypothetical protein
MQVVMFTCQRDIEKATLAVSTLPADWAVAWIVESKDADIKAPDGVEVSVRDFKRGHNLIGSEAVLAIADILLEYSRISGRVAKIDSDALIIDPSFLSQGDVSGMTHNRFLYAAYGMAYALSQKAAERCVDTLKRHQAMGYEALAEDVAITGAANQSDMVDGRLPLRSFWETRHDGSFCPAGRVAIHCGSVLSASRDGPAVATEMRRLIDELKIQRRL